MLPDFPEIKKELENIRLKYINLNARKDPLFSQIKEENIREGENIEVFENGKINPSVRKREMVRIEIDRDEIIAFGMKPFIDQITSQVDKIVKYKHKMLEELMSEVVDMTGNKVDAKGREFTFDLFIDMIKKVDIDFDDEGKPYMPTFVVSPALALKLKKEKENWESNPEYKKMLESVMENKRKEWNVRESNRKLVD